MTIPERYRGGQVGPEIEIPTYSTIYVHPIDQLPTDNHYWLMLPAV